MGLKTSLVHIKGVVENMKKDTKKKLRVLGTSGVGGLLLESNRLSPSQEIIKELMNPSGEYNYSVS